MDKWKASIEAFLSNYERIAEALVSDSDYSGSIKQLLQSNGGQPLVVRFNARAFDLDLSLPDYPLAVRKQQMFRRFSHAMEVAGQMAIVILRTIVDISSVVDIENCGAAIELYDKADETMRGSVLGGDLSFQMPHEVHVPLDVYRACLIWPMVKASEGYQPMDSKVIALFLRFGLKDPSNLTLMPPGTDSYKAEGESVQWARSAS
ncbi:Hypothetical protein D9617_20g027000 [Elsinoe fawcettii]|nr:Hypothetical protein D9617_20g027000 [Elsinoe fawcettii]